MNTITIDGIEYSVPAAAAKFKGIGLSAIQIAFAIRTEWAMSDLIVHAEACRARARISRKAALKSRFCRSIR